MVERSVTVRVRAEMAQWQAAWAKAGQSIREVRGEIDKATQTRQGRARLDELGNGATMMGAAMLAGFGVAIGVAARFEKQMSEVRAITNANATEFDHLRTAALRAGEDTSFSATEAAKAQAELAKAGLTTAEILSGGLSGALDLAAAGTLDLAEAASIAAKTMNVFQLKAGDVGHIADVLAAAANKSATDVHEMGEALRMGGLAASASGMRLEETVGTLAAFADRALVGSDAGTSLKTMLMMLQAPTEKSSRLMRELGINAYDASGNFIGTTRLAGELQRALSGLTQQERNAALAKIFGADAMRAANVLYQVGEQGIRDYTAAVDDQGAATDVARIKTDNLLGDVERLTGSLETLAIESSTGASSGLRTLVQGADRLVGSLSGIPPAVQNAAVIIAGVAGASMLAAGAATRLGAAFAGSLDALGQLGPRGERAARGLDKAGKSAGRVAVALVAVNTAAALMGNSTNAQVEAYAKSLENFGRMAPVTGEAARLMGEDLEQLNYDLSTLDTGWAQNLGNGLAEVIEGFTGLGSVMDESMQHAKERLQALDSALAHMVESGKAQEAEQAYARLIAIAHAQGVSLNELNAALPEYQAAMQAAKDAANPLAAAQLRAAESAIALAKGWDDATVKAEGLLELYKALNGAAVDWAQAEIALEEAIDSAGEAVEKNGRTLDVHTEKGRANREALLQIAEATAAAMQARFDETQSVEEAQRIYEQGRQALIRTAMQMGATRKEAERLADEWLSMPKYVATQVVASTKAARDQLQLLIDKINKVNGKTFTYFVAQGGGNVEFRRGTSAGGTAAWGYGGIDTRMGYGGMPPAHIVDKPTVMYGERGWDEAYIPKGGDPARNLRTLAVAAAWEGRELVPMGQRSASAAGGGSVDYDALGASMARHLGPALAGLGGDTILSVSGEQLARANRRGENSLARRD